MRTNEKKRVLEKERGKETLSGVSIKPQSIAPLEVIKLFYAFSFFEQHSGFFSFHSSLYALLLLPNIADWLFALFYNYY